MLGELNNRGFLTTWGRFRGVGEVPVHSWGAGGDDNSNQTEFRLLIHQEIFI